MADTLKVLRVELTAGIAGFQKGFKEAAGSTEKLGQNIASLSAAMAPVATVAAAGFAAVASAATAVGVVMAYATKQTIAYADSMVDMATRTGHTVEWLQATKFAAEQSGSTLEQVETASKRLAKALGEGSEKTVKSLAAMGISMQQLGRMAPDEQMNTVLRVLSQIENPTQRAAIALQLFGRSGTMLLPMAADFETLRQRAEELGLVMSAKNAQAAEALGDKFGALESTFDGLVRNLGITVTSSAAVHEVMEILIQALAAASKWVAANRDTLRSLVVDGLLFVVNGFVSVLAGIGLLNDGWFMLRQATLEIIGVYEKAALTARMLYDVMAKPWAATDTITEYKRQLKEVDANVAAAVGQAKSQHDAFGNVLVSGALTAAKMANAIETLGNKEVDLGDKTKGAARDLELEGAAAEKLAKGVQSLADDLDKAFADAGAKGLTGLEGAFAKVEADSMKWSQKLQELVRDGLDPESAAAFEAEIITLTAALRENALEAERQKVLGQTFQDLAKEAQNIRDVLDATGGDLSNLTDDALAKLEKHLTEMAAAGAPVAGTLDLVRKRMDEVGLATTETAKQHQSYTEAQAYYWSLVEAQEEAAAAAAERAHAWWQQLYGDLTGLGALLGALGFEGVANTIAGAVDWMDQFDRAAEDGVLSWGEIGNLAAAAIEQFKRATDSASGMARALGGALTGAGIGAKIGGIFGPIGSAIGSAIGAVGGAIAGIFRKPSWAKVGEEAGRILGMAVSEELAKKIEETSKTLHISIKAATLLNLDEAIKESGKAASEFGDQIAALMKGVADSTIPAAQGIEEIGSLFDELGKEGTEAAKQLQVQMIQAARASGMVVPEMQAFVKDALDKAVAGVSGMAKGLKILTPEDATSQAYIFSATFWAVFKEQGIEGVKALQPAFADMQEQLAAGGFDVSAIFGPIQGIMDMLGSETLAPIVEGISGLQQALQGLSDSGYMTQGAFAAFQQQAQSGFDQLLAGGATSEAALTAIAPLLAQLQTASQMYGLQLDGNTQSLIAQANAAGIAFPTDPMQQMVTILTSIAKVLGADIPAAATAAGSAMGGLTGTVTTAATGAAQATAAGATAAFASLSATGQTTAGQISAAFAAMSLTPTEDPFANMPADALLTAEQIRAIFESLHIQIPIDYLGNPPGSPTPGPDADTTVPALAAGGIVTMPTLALVGEQGAEAVVPLDRADGYGLTGGDTYIISPSFNENPLQTFEGLQRQRAFTLKTMQRELSRDLANAVAAGRA